MKIHFAVIVAMVAGACVLSGCTGDRQAAGTLYPNMTILKAQQDARREYERSVADYRNCMAANQMSTCEGERRTMKANETALSATMQRP